MYIFSPLIQFQLLHSKYHLCAPSTRGLLLSTYIKFINLFPEIKNTIQDVSYLFVCYKFSFFVAKAQLHSGRVSESKVRGPGPKVIKFFSCSTQLSMKFQFLINTEIAQIK